LIAGWAAGATARATCANSPSGLRLTATARAAIARAARATCAAAARAAIAAGSQVHAQV